MKKWADRFNGLLLIAMFLGYLLSNSGPTISLSSRPCGTVELARFLFVWIVFIGAATLIKDNEHIRIAVVLTGSRLHCAAP